MLVLDHAEQRDATAQGGVLDGRPELGAHGIDDDIRAVGQELSASGDNTIAVTDDLVFEVVVENSGESQETQVVVRLVIRQQPRISKEQTIDVIASGETKTVRFSGFEEIAFSTQTTLSVTVEPVPGETNTDNNTREYPIIFTLS